MKTILSHFYNEEYLLPHWLKHHKQYFDHGVMFNYASTDNSVSIIKEICPTWEIIESRNTYFDAGKIETEIEEREAKLDGFRMVLNTTEFLIGNYNLLDTITEPTRIYVPTFIMVNPIKNGAYTNPIVNNLIEENQFGIDWKDDTLSIEHNLEHPFNYRSARLLHNKAHKYSYARHYSPRIKNMTIDDISSDFAILYYGYLSLNENIVKRKQGFLAKIPGPPHLHFTSGWMTEQYLGFQDKIVDLSDQINKLILKK